MTTSIPPRSLSSFTRSVPWCLASSVAALLLFEAAPAQGQTWLPGAGGSWNLAANWSPAVIPNAIGASVLFNSPTAARTVTTDSGAAGFTVGAIAFDITSTFSNSLTTGTAGSNLKLDNGGAGVTITTTGAGTGNTAISVPLLFNDTVTASVTQTASLSGAGSLNLTAIISGTGGFTKLGSGLATFGTGGKTYTGATMLNGGRLRISSAAQPSATSSFTVNAGGQLTILAAGGSFTFGTGPLNLNGMGATTGPFAAFPGAIRNETAAPAVFNNAVVLQSNTLLHIEGSATGAITFTNSVSGPGSLTLTAPASSANQGTLFLNALNTFAGGTSVNGGTIVLNAAAASLGLGSVTVDDALSPLSVAKLTIQSSVLNGISDLATLSLAGGGAAGVADENFVELQAGVNEIVGGLTLGGVSQGIGTYGSTLSGALFQNDDYFTGTGIVTVVPEPASAALLLGSLGLLMGRRRLSRKPGHSL